MATCPQGKHDDFRSIPCTASSDSAGRPACATALGLALCPVGHVVCRGWVGDCVGYLRHALAYLPPVPLHHRGCLCRGAHRQRRFGDGFRAHRPLPCRGERSGGARPGTGRNRSGPLPRSGGASPRQVGSCQCRAETAGSGPDQAQERSPPADRRCQADPERCQDRGGAGERCPEANHRRSQQDHRGGPGRG